MYLTGLALVALVGFALIALLVVARDIRTTTVPTSLILALLVGYGVFAAAAGWSRDEITASLIAASMVLFVGLLVSAIGWCRAGDGKFAAVCTLWLGAHQAPGFLLLALMFTLIILGLHRFGRPGLFRSGSRFLGRHGGAPIAVALAAAAILMIPHSPWVTSVA